MNHAAVIDTMIFGASLYRKNDLSKRYADHLLGRTLILSPQSVAELRGQALKDGWGETRMNQLEEKIRLARVAPIDNETSWAYSRLKATCIAKGHALGQKIHDGDRWIAAAAIRLKIPLVSHDGIFIDVPGLNLITEL